MTAPRAALDGAEVLASRSEVKRGEWERFRDAPFRVRACGSVAYKLGLVAAGLVDEKVVWLGDPFLALNAILLADIESSLFEELEPEPELKAVVPVISDGIPPLDSDLTPDEKREFIKLLNDHLPLTERAKNLAHLARMKGTKTAAVGLRAIQEINQICGLRGEKATEAAPMFVLSRDSSVSVTVTKVDK